MYRDKLACIIAKHVMQIPLFKLTDFKSETRQFPVQTQHGIIYVLVLVEYTFEKDLSFILCKLKCVDCMFIFFNKYK
jgi:hypothetical protein